ncbi:hypothetical protein LSTR_LSTR002768 [Laodelphax striatellus]|uniref:DRBM domain-containing protein n=1 Tax=Laodelphax striatellus TaxID=195883 RepID=A0A482WN42_LAOST|nr:hypothetical protein LSTR_LSTR002768 [Laodelphax striatellus]
MGSKKKLTFDNKKILAPMVRIGTLPMRLLCLDYGCDIVYTEEIIDYRLIRSERVVNDLLGTVDFIDKSDGSLVFRTCDMEKDRVVLQLGTADAQRALAAAKLVVNDVAGIDVNMGCPKEFSVKGGMGSALLSKPDIAEDIMRTLVENLPCTVTCKVRIFPDIESSLQFCQRMADCGIDAIAIHGRRKEERPQNENHNDFIRILAIGLTIPVIANGGSLVIDSYEDLDSFREETGSSSVMIARAAQWNCSIFRKSGKLPVDEVITAYLKYCVDYDNPTSNCKYCVQNMLREFQHSPKGMAFLESHTLEDICSLWDLGEYCKMKQSEYRNRGILCRREAMPEGVKRNLAEEGVVEMKCAFLRHLFQNNDLPKTQLLTWTRKKFLRTPIYETEQYDKRFRSIVSVNNSKYSSSFWEKNKRWSEQAAALVALCSLNVIDAEPLRRKGALR